MYRILLLNKTADLPGEKIWFDCKPVSWSRRISSPGGALLVVPQEAESAVEANFKKYKRVQIQRKNRSTGKYVPVYSGFIEAHNKRDEYIEILAPSMHEIFKKRLTETTRTMTGQGTTEANDLLTYTNGQNDTGVTAGTGDVTDTADYTVERRSVFRTWEEWAAATDAEFDITPEFEFLFKQTIGTDQSSVLHLVFREDGRVGNNVEDYQTGEDAKEMYNRVYGKSQSLTSTKENSASITEYGLLEIERTFEGANDQATLDALCQSYIDQVSLPPTDNQIRVATGDKRVNIETGELEEAGFDLLDFNIGDIITATIVTREKTVTEARRIIGFDVSIDEHEKETVLFTLGAVGIRVTAGTFEQNQVAEIKRRVIELENLL